MANICENVLLILTDDKRIRESVINDMTGVSADGYKYVTFQPIENCLGETFTRNLIHDPYSYAIGTMEYNGHTHQTVTFYTDWGPNEEWFKGLADKYIGEVELRLHAYESGCDVRYVGLNGKEIGEEGVSSSEEFKQKIMGYEP